MRIVRASALTMTLALALALAPVAAAADPPASKQWIQQLKGAGSALFAVAGFILIIRRYRQRSRLPREDRKFGDYRGPKQP